MERSHRESVTDGGGGLILGELPSQAPTENPPTVQGRECVVQTGSPIPCWFVRAGPECTAPESRKGTGRK